MLNDDFRIKYKSIPIAIDVRKDLTGTEIHNHLEFEILLITDGFATVYIGDKIYNAKKDDMFFINPLEVHSIKTDITNPYSRDCICFDVSLIQDNDISKHLKDELLYINHHIKPTDPNHSMLKNHFRNIMASYNNHTKYSDMEIKSYISLLFSHLLKNNLICQNSVKSKSTLFCSNVLAYIGEHYSENITSKTVASALSYNQSYFCRNFYKNFGRNFSDYLNMYRISQSRQFLEKGEKNITQVAYACGFNSHTYFSKSFKKHLGILPSEYKKELK